MSTYDPLDGLQPTLWQLDRYALHRHGSLAMLSWLATFFGSSTLVMVSHLGDLT